MIEQKIFNIYRLIEPLKQRFLYTAFGFNFTCKHSPTCSVYTEKQINKHGTIVGSLKGLVRILSCW
jgi:putative component of membrane protein insertase Oxa1/YidC/SpoIIIJ protein YidD